MNALQLRLVKLADEYRPTMDQDVLHSWAKDVVQAIRQSEEGPQ
ncbi:hypothetical protein PROPHIGD54-2_144 [Mycobacterium phage prophiGD54-2]|nr:hypothetical protein [Mycobacteroides abscessus]QSM04722.1 hypothetical protein PROPHIGD54-2_144 [Mycobacterium phage prophiGD54-2]